MTSGLACLVLLAAALHATWNAMLKGGRDRAWTMMIMLLTTLPVSAVALLFLPMPAAAGWHWLIGGALTHAGYRVSLVRAFRHGELGEIYPISRGASPMMVTAGFAIVDGDHPNWLSLAGIPMISAGITALRQSDERRLPPAALISALMTAAFTASCTIVHGIEARQAGSAGFCQLAPMTDLVACRWLT